MSSKADDLWMFNESKLIIFLILISEICVWLEWWRDNFRLFFCPPQALNILRSTEWISVFAKISSLPRLFFSAWNLHCLVGDRQKFQNSHAKEMKEKHSHLFLEFLCVTMFDLDFRVAGSGPPLGPPQVPAGAGQTPPAETLFIHPWCYPWSWV